MAGTVLAATKEVNTKIFVGNLMFFKTGNAMGLNAMLVTMVKAPKRILPDLDNIDHSTIAG